MGQAACCLDGVSALILRSATPTTPKSSCLASSRRTCFPIAARVCSVGHLSNEFDIQQQAVGKGMNGPVMLAIGKDQKKYAVKTCSETEAEVHLSLDHPHVVKLHRIFGEGPKRALVMEYMAGGDLFSQLVRRRRYKEAAAADLLRQMLRSVAYLHAHGVVHRDLKLENFMFDSPDYNHVVLIDFGLARFWDREQGKMTK